MDKISSNFAPLFDLVIESCKKRNKEAVENLLKSLITLSGSIIEVSGRMPSLFGISLRYLQKNSFIDIQLIFERLKREWQKFSETEQTERTETKRFGNEICRYSPGHYKVYTEDKVIAKQIRNMEGIFSGTKHQRPNGKFGFEFIIPESLYYKILLIMHTPPYVYFLNNKRTGQLKIDF